MLIKKIDSFIFFKFAFIKQFATVLLLFFVFSCSSSVKLGDNDSNNYDNIAIPKTKCVEENQGIFILPNILIFQKILTGSNSTLSFEVGNFGDSSITLSGADVSATKDGDPVTSPFSVQGLETSKILNPPDSDTPFYPGQGVETGDKVTVNVSFSASEAGDYEGEIVLHFEGLEDQSVYLAGSALSAISVRTVTGCDELDEDGATYTLDPPGSDTEITSSGRCIYITGSNVTFDLAGNTINYGGNGSDEQYGIQVYGPNAVVKNGKIVQSPGAGEDSHGIMINGPSVNTVIENMDVTVSSQDSINICAPWHPNLMEIRDNILNSNVDSITSRSQWDGRVIGTTPAVRSGVFSRYGIHHNTISGGAQAGIVVTGDSSQVYSNTIRQNGYYTNDFAIGLKDDSGIGGRGIEVFDNLIEPVSGRGIHMLFKNNLVHHNTIVVRVLYQYKGDGTSSGTTGPSCEPGGAYGIQLEDSEIGTTGNLIYGNSVIAEADECRSGGAFRISGIGVYETETNSDNSVCNNVFKSVRVEDTSMDANSLELTGVYLDAGFLIKGNLFEADSAIVSIDWNGAPGGAIFQGNTFKKSENPSDFYTLDVQNSGAADKTVENLYFLDTTFENDTNLASGVDWRTNGGGEFYLGYILNLTVTDAGGSPVSGAQVQIRDTQGDLIENAFSLGAQDLFTFAADSNGEIQVPLPELKWEKPVGVSDENADITLMNPYTFFVREGSNGDFEEVSGTFTASGIGEEHTIAIP